MGAHLTRENRGLRQLLEKIYHERGFDFREYRETTLRRRIGRRLRFRGQETYEEYARLLDQDPQEYNRLFDDLTINVTSFFRDQIAFEALAERVLPVIVRGDRRKKGPVRIWSAGCATGAEPYSIAILSRELAGGSNSLDKITIVGTDIDPKALDRARDGHFGSREVEGIQAAWIKKYFLKGGNDFRIRPMIQNLVDFHVHDLTKDPPLKDMDLVVCRNTLIYFTPALQIRVLKALHAGLKPRGFLLLGKAEVPTGETKHLFDCVEYKARLYRKA